MAAAEPLPQQDVSAFRLTGQRSPDRIAGWPAGCARRARARREGRPPGLRQAGECDMIVRMLRPQQQRRYDHVAGPGPAGAAGGALLHRDTRQPRQSLRCHGPASPASPADSASPARACPVDLGGSLAPRQRRDASLLEPAWQVPGQLPRRGHRPSAAIHTQVPAARLRRDQPTRARHPAAQVQHRHPGAARPHEALLARKLTRRERRRPSPFQRPRERCLPILRHVRSCMHMSQATVPSRPCRCHHA